MVIDSGSTKNFVSQEMVDKLSLETEKLVKPYKVAWFKEGVEVPKTHRCLVKFSISKNYKDEIWCDVVSLEVCHILLGHPWQYDRKTQHDGEKNTYTFKKDKFKIALYPQKDAKVPNKKVERPTNQSGVNSKSVMILNEHEFERIESDSICLSFSR